MQNFPDPKQYYKILEITPQDEASVIKNQYLKLAKFWHPDHNQAPDAMENFQKLSVAYNILKDEKQRLYYDLLSLVYSEKDFPDVEIMSPFLNSDGDLDLNIRSITIYSVIGKIFTAKATRTAKIMTFSQAKRALKIAAIKNWTLGWWGITAAVKNLKAIFANLRVFNNSKRSNLQLFIHNMIVFNEEGKTTYAYLLADLAKKYAANEYEISLINKFIAFTNIYSEKKLPDWDYNKLKPAQFFMPAVFSFILLLVASSLVFAPIFFAKHHREINYNQTVKGVFGDTFDDVVVGKIVNIPVDTADTSKLCHLRSDTKIMYGPNDNFDVLTTLEKGHTLRITGYTPDNVWYRVMLDSGEDGFVKSKEVAKGIGNEIPPTSKIYK